MSVSATEKVVLPRETIDFYNENGYVAVRDVLTADELEEARKLADAVIKADEEARSGKIDAASLNAYEQVFLQKVNLWRVDEGIKKFSLHPRLAEMARQLAGAKAMRIWHDHLLAKRPKDGKPTYWHQDFPYWPMEDRNDTLSIWIALDDVNESNGCMSFVPGSHKVGPLDPIHLDTDEEPTIVRYFPDRDPSEVSYVSQPLKAGSATFHNGLTFHAAYANRTPRYRRALVIIYIPDGTVYDGSAHMVTDGQGFEVGKPLAGELFPIVASIE